MSSAPFAKPLIGWAIAAALGLGLAFVVARPQKRSDVVPITETPLADSSAVVDRCAHCHQEVVDVMRDAPHFNTLTWAGDQEVLRRFAGKTFVDAQTEATLEYFTKDKELWCRSTALEQPVQLNWVFGSGSHAQTPVSLFPDADGRWMILQHRLSWYPGVGVALTLGADDDAAGAPTERLGLENHGDWQTVNETLACFRCHSSQLDANQLNQPTGVQPGLGCLRCHVNAEAHADQQEGVAGGGSDMIAWRPLTAREHVNRCGECHRRADQVPTDEITTEADHIVRFASVGLLQSKCFLASEKSSTMRLDCMTCHDPHRPASRSAEHYAAKCLECHDRPSVSDCSRQPAGKACVSCHMRKRKTQPHLEFTDHWIR